MSSKNNLVKRSLLRGFDNDTLTGGSGSDQIFGDGNVSQGGDDIIDGGSG